MCGKSGTVRGAGNTPVYMISMSTAFFKKF